MRYLNKNLQTVLTALLFPIGKDEIEEAKLAASETTKMDGGLDGGEGCHECRPGKL